MFTGLIQFTGKICGRSISGAAGKLRIKIFKPLDNPEKGESIAVNGACLTLEKANGELLEFHVMEETFNRSNLGELPIGAEVNMERALALGDRLGGHLVSGHVDATANVISFQKSGSDMELKVKTPDSISAYLVPKGSICIDGVSLTIASTGKGFFTVRIIPTTWDETNLKNMKSGSAVNLEADMIGKYVRFQLESMFGKNTSGKTIEMADLINAGFLE